MPEQGGTTTQSGISYQNLYAALRIAEMLSGQDLPATSKITGVRVEAPVNVDDVVVTYEDEHRDYVQAKENLSASGGIWRKIWRQFLQQYEKPDFDRVNSRLILCVGSSDEDFVFLETMFESVKGRQNFSEWRSRLSKNAKLQALWQDKIEKLFAEGQPLASIRFDKWDFLRCVRVQVRLRDFLDRQAILTLPSSQNDNGLIPPHTLHSNLCKYISDDAGDRVEHTFVSLSERLESDHRIRLYAPPPLAQLLDAIYSCSATLRSQHGAFGSIAESHIERPVAADIVEWMLTTGDPRKNIAVLLDGPGRGKTVVLRDVLAKLEEQNIVTLAIKADRQLTDLSPGRHLHECTGVALPAPVEDVVRWVARSQTKPIVVLLDQVDALSLSMTREPYALEVIARVMERLQGLHNVRVLLSCRTFDLNTTPTLRDLDIQQKFEIPDLSKDEISKVLDKVGVRYEDVAPPAQKLLRVPLHLDLFARVIERQQEKGAVTAQLRNVRTLQDLYHIIWERSVLSPEAPVSSQDRTEVIQRIVLQMEKDERTSAPFFIFDDADSKHLKSAVPFLESQGILQRENTGSNWNFLHQTFYDYAYARFFVASGQSLSQKIFSSPQGLTERPLLQHVLGFLRSTNPQEYERELMALGIDELFEDPNLRKHLRHMLRQWFGTLPQPNEIEWNRVRRMLRNSELRVKFLNAAGGNEGWFSRLAEEHIPRWLREIQSGRLDDTSINVLFWFLMSVVDSPNAQPQITAFLAPYLGRSEQWDNLLKAWVSRIRQWHSMEAIRLYEKLLLKNWKNDDSLFLYHLRYVAKQHPLQACRILEPLLAQAELPDKPHKYSWWTRSFWEAFADKESGGLKIDEEVLKTLAEATPNEFLESIWPFFERVLRVSVLPEENETNPDFPTDAFSDTWSIRNTRGVMHRHHFGFALSQAMGKALQLLVDRDVSQCREWLKRLEGLHYETPQMLVLDVYAKHPQLFAGWALSFLCGDSRRLELGELQCETRRLIREVAPFWSPSQCAELESRILAHDRLPYYLRLGQRNLYLLQRRGVEQWGLLLALGRERLTVDGQRRLREWDNKFRGQKLPDEPILGESGFVGSPIEISKVQKMSDQAWLRAMGHYQGDITHRREFLKGGAEQLSRVLQGCAKEQPERFARLFLKKVPLDVDAFYAKALLQGLAESSAPSELLFDVVRRLQHHSGPDVFGDLARTIADVLDKRADEGLPSDLMELMQSWVDTTPPGRFDESYYARQMDEKIARLELGEGNASDFDSFSGVAMDYINCSRGKAISAIFKSLEATADLEKLWQWVEEMSNKPSDLIRVGALDGLLSVCHHDIPRAVRLFEALCDKRQNVLRTEYAHRFLFWAIHKRPEECRIFIDALLQDPFDRMKRTGAEMAAVLALQPNKIDLMLIEKLKSGPLAWQEGLVEVASNNVTSDLASDTLAACIEILRWSFQQTSDALHHRAIHFSHRLREEHLDTLKPLLEDFVTSPTYSRDDSGFHEFLLRYGDIEPDWTLSQIETILQRSDLKEQGFQRLGEEELSRCVLRLYNLTSSNTPIGQEFRAKAMDVFGELVEKSPFYSNRILKEWDEGHDGRFF